MTWATASELRADRCRFQGRLARVSSGLGMAQLSKVFAMEARKGENQNSTPGTHVKTGPRGVISAQGIPAAQCSQTRLLTCPSSPKDCLKNSRQRAPVEQHRRVQQYHGYTLKRGGCSKTVYCAACKLRAVGC